MPLKFANPGNQPQTRPEEPKQQQPEISVTAGVVAKPAVREFKAKKESVNHPDHYGGKDNPYEVIKVIRAWDLSFSLGNVVKYVARAGRKDPAKRLEDLHKAAWYLQEEIANEYEKGIK